MGHSNEATLSDNALFNLMSRRRSVRRYTGGSVDDSALRQILADALLAPSSFGSHPVHFWVVRGSDNLKRLAACKSMGAPSVADSDAAIVVAVDASATELWVEDGACATAYIVLAAEDQGIGACWNQVRGRRGRCKSTSDEIKDLLGIPEQFEVVSMVSLGIKSENKRPRTEEDLHAENLHGIDLLPRVCASQEA